MITKSERNKIKKVLGKYYCQPISDYLFNNGIRNKYGRPHSDTMITNVMNGQPHKEIETAIYIVVAQKKEELLAEEQKRKEILSK